MGKLIAVWGAPNSGKTALSVKLAEAIYSRSRGKSSVIVVFTDIVTPTQIKKRSHRLPFRMF